MYKYFIPSCKIDFVSTKVACKFSYEESCEAIRRREQRRGANVRRLNHESARAK